MSIRTRVVLGTLALSLPLAAPRARAQGPSSAAVALVRAELPDAAARRVVERAASATLDGIAGDVLLERALRLARHGVAPDAIADAIDAHAARMSEARTALRAAGTEISPDAVDAGAELLRRGIGAAVVTEVARRSPAGSALPLTVLGALVDRGVPVDEGLAMISTRLATAEGASSLASLPDESRAGQPPRTLPPGLAIAARHRAGASAGRPAALPSGGAGRGRAGGTGGPRGGRP